MESAFDVYTTPADTSGEPIGRVTGDSPRNARRDIARIIKLGYELRLTDAR